MSGAGERVEGKQGKGKRGKVEGGKSKRRVPNKDSLFHHHHPNFDDFFPRAVAPCTDIVLFLKNINCQVNDYV